MARSRSMSSGRDHLPQGSCQGGGAQGRRWGCQSPRAANTWTHAAGSPGGCVRLPNYTRTPSTCAHARAQAPQGAHAGSAPGIAATGSTGGALLEDLQQGGVAAGTLRGPPTNVLRGDVTLTVFIEKWGFKDATEFAEPRVTVTVWDGKGQLLEAVQVRRSSGAATSWGSEGGVGGGRGRLQPLTGSSFLALLLGCGRCRGTFTTGHVCRHAVGAPCALGCARRRRRWPRALCSSTSSSRAPCISRRRSTGCPPAPPSFSSSSTGRPRNKRCVRWSVPRATA